MPAPRRPLPWGRRRSPGRRGPGVAAEEAAAAGRRRPGGRLFELAAQIGDLGFGGIERLFLQQSLLHQQIMGVGLFGHRPPDQRLGLRVLGHTLDLLELIEKVSQQFAFLSVHRRISQDDPEVIDRELGLSPMDLA